MTKKINKDEIIKPYLDKSLPLEERKKIYNEFLNKIMNPDVDFNPDKFNATKAPEEELSERTREKPPKKLPVFQLNPRVIREGQRIGLFENKQDLYLTFAHRCNELQEEVDLLKERLDKIDNKI